MGLGPLARCFAPRSPPFATGSRVFSLCVADADPSDTTNVDTDDPAPGVVFSYLVRAVNACPNGRGTIGVDSVFVERLASACP